jgi:hypothetical protein
MKKKYLTRFVNTILTYNEDSRDDILIVVKTIHDFELSLLSKSKEDYYECFFSKKLSSVNSIDRVSRKLQEHNPNIRGKEWEDRQVHSRFVAKYIRGDKSQLDLFL